MLGQMKLNARVSPAAIELVKRFEGLRTTAARLEDGGWTVGYGHVVFAREGVTVTPDDAEVLLRYDLNEIANALDHLITAPVHQHQYYALV